MDVAVAIICQTLILIATHPTTYHFVTQGKMHTRECPRMSSWISDPDHGSYPLAPNLTLREEVIVKQWGGWLAFMAAHRLNPIYLSDYNKALEILKEMAAKY